MLTDHLALSGPLFYLPINFSVQHNGFADPIHFLWSEKYSKIGKLLYKVIVGLH